MVMGEWQDISSAPKDESATIVLVLSACHPDEYDAAIATAFWGPLNSWVGGSEGWCNWNAGLDEDDIWEEVKDVTHWQPLPPPPSHWQPLPPPPKAEVIYEPEGEG
jgi:hypothetical protein